MPDDRRLRLRRRLLVLGLVPLLLALALSVKVGMMLGLDDRGRSAFSGGDFERASSAFAANGTLNVFEPWVAAFDQGTADYRLADYATARDLLEEALLVVPAERECLVRINLALTLEALGDAGLADSRRDLAEAFWREGIAVLDEGSCRDPAADNSTEEEAAAAGSVADRLADKLADRADPDDPESPDPDPPTLEELEQRNEEAQEQRRRNQETREDDQEPTPSPTPTPPPENPDDPEPSAPPSYSW